MVMAETLPEQPLDTANGTPEALIQTQIPPSSKGSSDSPEDVSRHTTRFTPDTKQTPASANTSISHLFRFKRADTNLEHAPTEESVTSHKFILRRPRVLQVKYDGRLIEVGDEGATDIEMVQRNLHREEKRRGSSVSDEPERRSTDFVDTQRERLELFIDLLFVGVITNISEHFFTRAFAEDSTPGYAIGEFVLLFLPTWRIFSELQLFLSSYYMDDMIQRLLILWVIVLSLVWGNNAPYFLGAFNGSVTQAQSQFTIATFLVAVGSLHVAEVIYSIWIPWIRRLMLVGWFITIPVTGLWIGIILTSNNVQVDLLITVLAFDYVANTFLRSPVGDRLLGNSEHLRKALNPTHTRKRYEQFYTIALGEGVILLLRSSPLGEGLGRQVGAGIQAILVYFFLHWLYFNGDQSKSKIHALHRRWYIASLWQLAHVVLYGSLLLLSSGVLGLIEYVGVEYPAADITPSETAALIWQRAESEADTRVKTYEQMRVASVTVSASLAVTLLMTLVIALSSRSLDGPRTLLVNNRFIRMVPRGIAVIIFALIWMVDFPDPLELLGVLASVMAIVSLWEWHAAMEREWKWLG